MQTLADIRQQYPQYKDMSDQDLADALYKKFYADMPRDQFNQKIGLNPAKNATAQNMRPFTLPPDKGILPGATPPMTGGILDRALSAFSAGADRGVPWTPQEQQMAQNGVDITSGAPQGLLQRLSLQVRPDDKDIFSEINQYYGHDVAPSRNKYGEIEFTGPSGRRMLLNSHLLGKQLIPTVGGTADVAGQTAGAAVGSATMPFLGGIGAIPGAAAGQAIIDSGKRLASKWLGIPDTSYTTSDVAKNAGGAAVGAAVGYALGSLPKVYRLATKGEYLKALSGSKANDLLHAAYDAQDNLSDFWTFLGNNPDLGMPVFSVAELVPGNVEARTAFGEAAKSTVDSSPWIFGHGSALANIDYLRDKNNVDALTGAWDKVTDAYKPDGYRFGTGTENVRNSIIQEQRAQFNSKQALLKSTQNNAIEAARGLPQKTSAQLQQELSNIIYTKERSGWQNVRDAYSRLQQALGVPRPFADNPMDTDRFLATNFDPSPRISYTPTTMAKLNGIWVKGLSLLNEAREGNITGAKAEQYFDAIPSELFVDPDHPAAGLKLEDSNYKNSISLREFIQAIQDRRAGLRKVSSRLGNIPPDAQLDKQVTDILRDNVNQFFQREGDPTLADAWEEAEQTALDYRKKFREGVLGDLINSAGGKPNPVYNQAVTKILLSAGRGNYSDGPLALNQLRDIVKGDPEAEQNIRNMIWSIYGESYRPQGVNVSPAAIANSWTRFKSEMRAPIESFFDKNDLASLDTFDDMNAKMIQQNQDLKNFKAEWQALPWGRLPLNSQALSRAAINDKSISPGQWRGLMAYLNVRRPDLLKEFQADTAESVSRSARFLNGEINPDGLFNTLTQNRARLMEILGPEYVANATAIAKTAKLAKASGPSAEEPKSIFEQIVRSVIAPPMSKEGRGYTGLLLARKRAALRVIYNALSSVDGLENFVSRTRGMTNLQHAGGVLGAFGGASWANNPLNNSAQPPASPAPPSSQPNQ